MTPEQRQIARLERVFKTMARRGRTTRNDFRAQINILIDTQMKYGEEWRAKHRAMDEKINILINAQIATDEQLKGLVANQAKTDEQLDRLTANQAKTDEQLDRLTVNQAKTDEQLDRLTVNQAKTDDALRRFIDSLRKNRNGSSSD